MHKLLAFAAAALIVAVPALAYACLNGVLIIEQDDIRELDRAERLLVAGKLEATDSVIERYRRYYGEFEGKRAHAFSQRVRLLDATVGLRLLVREKPIDLARLVSVTRQLRNLQADDGRTPPLFKARLAEALVLHPSGMNEAKLLITDLEKRDLMPEAEAWVTLAKVRAYLHDVDGMSAALRRCEKMAGKRKPQVCHAAEPAS